MSPEAARFLEQNSPTRLPPLNRLTAPLLRRIAARRSAASVELARSRFPGTVEDTSVAGVPVVVMRPPQGAAPSSDDYVVFVHGGAFVLGAALDPIGLQLAAATGLPTYSVEYRLAPRAQFPVALHECRDVWADLTSRLPGRPVLVGVSAGATLALGLTQLLHAIEGARLPHALVAMTPLTDAREDAARRPNEGRDPLLRWDGQVDRALASYLGSASPDDPLVSPLRADWHGVDVATLVTTGSIDLLHHDCTSLVHRMRDHGVPVTLDDAPGLWHAYQNRPELPEARAGVDRVAAFVTEALSAA